MHHAIGLGLLIYLIGYAFGKRTARACVAAALLTILATFAYVMYRVVEGTI